MQQSVFFEAAEALDTVWTDEQEMIFAHIRAMPPGAALAIKARAGSGKTTTAIEAMFHARREDEANRMAILAFNKKMGDELGRKTPANVRGSTFHSLARTMVTGELEIGKMWRIAKSLIEDRRFKLRSPAVQLASLAKNLGIGLPGGVPDDLDIWTQLVGEYGICHQKRFTPEEVAAAARRLFQAAVKDTRKVDFDDMLYFVARDGVGKDFQPLDWLFVDEFQDTNPTQLLMIDQIRKASGGHTRLVLIGDPAQAIYGWRGAGVHSFDIGVKRYKAAVLTLTQSFRCSVAVIQSAQEIVPDIRPRPDAPEGSVEELRGRDFDIVDLEDGAVVLCRNNAPLFELALEAVDRDRAIHIAGKGLDKKIVKLFQKLFQQGKRDPNDRSVFSDEIIRIEDEYRDRPLAKSILMDEVMAARSIWDVIRRKTGPWRSYTEFTDAAEDVMGGLFFDPAEGRSAKGVILSTIHMSKGLEWDTVYYYRPELLPSKAAQKLGGWHLEQEFNLDYVARTRAKNRLIFVRGTIDGTEDGFTADEGGLSA